MYNSPYSTGLGGYGSYSTGLGSYGTGYGSYGGMSSYGMNNLGNHATLPNPNNSS